MLKYSTEYLIIHENTIDWEKLSSDKEDMFSLVEIRLFRSKINWKKYLQTHSRTCPFTTQMLEVASKYFTPEIYGMLAAFDIPQEDFIENHLEDFSPGMLIMGCSLSEDFFLNHIDYWKDWKDHFNLSQKIDLESSQYARLKLLLEVDD